MLIFMLHAGSRDIKVIYCEGKAKSGEILGVQYWKIPMLRNTVRKQSAANLIKIYPT